MLIVQKFGGSSVANADRVRHVAGIIADTYSEGHDIVVVLSAQGDTTDDLIEKARELNPRPSKREMDVLLSTGEQQSVALMAMALEAMGLPVVSLTGWQVGMETNTTYGSARIVRVSTERIRRELDKRRIVIVAGFQGVDRNDDITTLGRGGSDTTAVAIAAVLHADKCQIYTDVEGVYTADPRKVPGARKLDEITYDEMLELASLGAQVLMNRSVELAKRYGVIIEVLSSMVRKPGTKVKEVAKRMEEMKISGIAKDNNVARLVVVGVPDEPGMAFRVFNTMARAKINVDIILQSYGKEGTNDISFTVPSTTPTAPPRPSRSCRSHRLRPPQRRHQRLQGQHRRRRHDERLRHRRAHVRGPLRREDKHPDDLHQRDKGQRPHRQGLRRPGSAGNPQQIFWIITPA